MRGPLIEILETLWKESAFPVAQCVAQQSDISECSAEAQVVWGHLPATVQDELIGFAQMKAFESAQAYRILERLQQFATEFFDPRREEQVVRRLCVSGIFDNSRSGCLKRWPQRRRLDIFGRSYWCTGAFASVRRRSTPHKVPSFILAESFCKSVSQGLLLQCKFQCAGRIHVGCYAHPA